MGALLSASGALWAGHRQQIFDSDIHLKNQQLLSKSDEIARMQETIRLSVTGSGYCFIALTNLNRTTNEQNVMLMNPGGYPLYDVGIRVVDLKKWEDLAKGGSINYESMRAAETIYQFGELGPERVLDIGKWDLGDSDARDFNIFISSRSGFISERLRLRRVEGEWVAATQVVKGNTTIKDNVIQLEGEILHETIHDKFPRNASGVVDW